MCTDIQINVQVRTYVKAIDTVFYIRELSTGMIFASGSTAAVRGPEK